MRPLLLAIGLIGFAVLSSVCHAQPVDDPFSDYLERSDSILLGAGNASAANAAIQRITPWPPYVRDTRIHIDGRRGADAIERMHHVPEAFERQGAGSGAVGGGTGVGGEGGSLNTTVSSPSTPMQPISDGY
jgi:hypothetical protein